MLWPLFRRKAAPPPDIASLPRAVRDEILSMCRAEALDRHRADDPAVVDCGCLTSDAGRF